MSKYQTTAFLISLAAVVLAFASLPASFDLLSTEVNHLFDLLPGFKPCKLPPDFKLRSDFGVGLGGRTLAASYLVAMALLIAGLLRAAFQTRHRNIFLRCHKPFKSIALWQTATITALGVYHLQRIRSCANSIAW